MIQSTSYTVYYVSLLLIFLLSRLHKLYKGILSTGNIPGFWLPLQPFSYLSIFIKTSRWNIGLSGVWVLKDTLYTRFGRDTISVTPFISGKPTLFTSNLHVAKQVLGGVGNTGFEKPLFNTGAIGFWGENLVTSEGDVWRKHRRILGPAFSRKLYELVWSESTDLVNQMLIAEGFQDKNEVAINSVQRLTSKFTFYVIGRCGFDFHFNWERAGESVEPFVEAMGYFVNNLMISSLPQAVFNNIPLHRFKKMKESVAKIRKFMSTKIAEKELLCNSGELGDDIFSVLVQANQAEKNSKLKLDYNELVGNIYIMMFAGHETTSHTIASTLACLAMFPDEQQIVYEHILAVIGDGHNPSFEDFSKLDKVHAAFYEALRFFPSLFFTARESREDTVIQVPKSLYEDECTSVPIPKNTQVVIDIVGLHRNPRYYDEPDLYKPSRWYGISNESDAIPGFGFGPRACIGRKFALTEAICFLTMVLRGWKVEPLLTSGETTAEWFAKISTMNARLALGISDVPIRFVRRS